MVEAIVLIQDYTPWGQLAAFGPTVIILALILMFLLKAAPTWKDVKLREIGIRDEEAKAKMEHATALKLLGGSLEELGRSLSSSTNVLEKVAIEQRRATEAARIVHRAAAQSNERLWETVQELVSRLEGMEQRHAEEDERTNAH